MLLMATAVASLPGLALAEGAGPPAANATYASRSVSLGRIAAPAFEENQGEGWGARASNATNASNGVPVGRSGVPIFEANQSRGAGETGIL
jgi:hypothetical protein